VKQFGLVYCLVSMMPLLFLLTREALPLLFLLTREALPLLSREVLPLLSLLTREALPLLFLLSDWGGLAVTFAATFSAAPPWPCRRRQYRRLHPLHKKPQMYFGEKTGSTGNAFGPQWTRSSVSSGF
jgi:hypothetical protein